MVYWIYLLLAGAGEMGFIIGMKMSDGFTKPIITILTVVSMLLSLFLMSMSIKGIPVGTAYAVWTSMGTVGAVVIGMAMFNEPINVVKVVCIILIISGIVGLKLFTGEAH